MKFKKERNVIPAALILIPFREGISLSHQFQTTSYGWNKALYPEYGN